MTYKYRRTTSLILVVLAGIVLVSLFAVPRVNNYLFEPENPPAPTQATSPPVASTIPPMLAKPTIAPAVSVTATIFRSVLVTPSRSTGKGSPLVAPTFSSSSSVRPAPVIAIPSPTPAPTTARPPLLPTAIPLPTIIVPLPTIRLPPLVASRNFTRPDLVKQYAATKVDATQYSCLDKLWSHESGWRPWAANDASTAYGVAQLLTEKSSSAVTQVLNGLAYIAHRYVTPCRAWAFWIVHRWY